MQNYFLYILVFLFFHPLFGIDFEINFANKDGIIKNLNGVNNGPRCLLDLGYCNLCQNYKEMGVNIIRTHDFYGPTDWDYIFPQFSKDPEDPSAYNFKDSDEYILAIYECGEEIYFRMGISWGGNPAPPGDPEKWAKIVVQILKHYNDGWNNGYNLGIKYVEIWNEPDLDVFWAGTDEEYFLLYEKAAKAIKNYNKNIKVGGPALAYDLNFLERFLKYCKNKEVPLDFVSWHHYGSKREGYNPLNLKNISLYIKELMKKYGFSNSENHLTEYNRSLEGEQIENNLNLIGAVWHISALIVFQDSELDLAFRYRGDVHPLGMWWPKDNPWIVQEAFNSFNEILNYSERYSAIKYQSDDNMFLIAGCKEGKNSCRAIISDISEISKNYNVNVNGLTDGNWIMKLEVLDEKGWALIFKEEFSGTHFSKNIKQKGPFFGILKIYNSKHKRPF